MKHIQEKLSRKSWLNWKSIILLGLIFIFLFSYISRIDNNHYENHSPSSNQIHQLTGLDTNSDDPLYEYNNHLLSDYEHSPVNILRQSDIEDVIQFGEDYSLENSCDCVARFLLVAGYSDDITNLNDNHVEE